MYVCTVVLRAPVIIMKIQYGEYDDDWIENANEIMFLVVFFITDGLCFDVLS